VKERGGQEVWYLWLEETSPSIATDKDDDTFDYIFERR